MVYININDLLFQNSKPLLRGFFICLKPSLYTFFFTTKRRLLMTLYSRFFPTEVGKMPVEIFTSDLGFCCGRDIDTSYFVLDFLKFIDSRSDSDDFESLVSDFFRSNLDLTSHLVFYHLIESDYLDHRYFDIFDSSLSEWGKEHLHRASSPFCFFESLLKLIDSRSDFDDFQQVLQNFFNSNLDSTIHFILAVLCDKGLLHFSGSFSSCSVSEQGREYLVLVAPK